MTPSYPNENSDCPCQSGRSFAQCCQPLFHKTFPQIAKTAEQLMRSRYCAFTFADSDYLLNTWHINYRPASLKLDDEDGYAKQQWIGLKIKKVYQGSEHDDTGQVHFIARYKLNGKAYKLEENSFFKKIEGRWFYLYGE